MCLRSTCTAHKPEHRNQVFECPSTPRMWQWHLSDGKGCISKHHKTQPIRMKCSSSIPTVLKHNQQTNKKKRRPPHIPCLQCAFLHCDTVHPVPCESAEMVQLLLLHKNMSDGTHTPSGTGVQHQDSETNVKAAPTRIHDLQCSIN